jgi:protein SCO1/2
MNFPTAPARRPSQFFPAAALLLLSLAGCSAQPENVQRYDLKGKVIAVDRREGSVTIDHEEIKGYMSGMTMSFPLKDADALKVVEAGDTIQATLAVADSGYWLESPAITKAPAGGAAPAAVAGLEPQPGAELPEVRLVNQDGKKISTSTFKGRALLVTFIYTRCPFPDQCPLMSANFAQLNGELAKDTGLRARTRLLSVTLDPEYDKPEVLRAYGAAYAGGKFDNWDFATGDPDEIRRLAQFLGLAYKAENGQVVHSLRTALVSPEGRLVKIYRGNEWKPSEVLDDLKGVQTQK